MEALASSFPCHPERGEGAARPRPAADFPREAPAVPAVVARLLAARGIETAEEAERFFHPDLSHLHDPFELLGAEEASAVLLRAARSDRSIVVFGDYDVDGVTAVAQLRAALLRAGARAIAFLPHRLKDGYGLRPETVRRVLRDLSPSVIVTVDCGITAADGVACAREAGVEVVVTDHHLVPDRLPEGAVVVNPKQPGCPYPGKDLSGAGIAMKLSEAVARRAGVSLSRESLLRAACLGTIADLVPLTGENRAIAALGLEALARPRAPGLAALLQDAGIEPGRPPTAEEVAFRVAPRLNAAGRLDTAQLALALFEEKDPARARGIARELSARNGQRQSIERRVFLEAKGRVERDFDPERDAILVEGDAGWHRGVLGIAAARLAREYHRPVLLFALDGERACGSGRSVPGVALHDTLSEIRRFFLEFGGHDQAVGGTLLTAQFAAFRQEARALFAERIPRESLVPREAAEAELSLDEISDRLLLLLERFEPHGIGNPRPVFSCGGVRAAGPFRPLGERGWRGRFSRDAGDLDAVCWSEGTPVETLTSSPDPFRMHYRAGVSRWSGRAEIEVVGAWPGEGASRAPEPVAGRP